MKCGQCGREFNPPKKTSKYCCTACQYASFRKKKPTARCKQCGEYFEVARDRKGMFCSSRCQSLYYGTRRSARAEEKREAERRAQAVSKLSRVLINIAYKKQREIELIHECAECGALFQAKSVRDRFCSAVCRNRNDNRRRDKRIYRNGKPDLSISITRLYMRDMGVCQLCGKHIDFDCDSNSDNYPSIDHIVPLSKGGLHEWDNVQLACRRCNTLKSNKTPPRRF